MLFHHIFQQRCNKTYIRETYSWWRVWNFFHRKLSNNISRHFHQRCFHSTDKPKQDCSYQGEALKNPTAFSGFQGKEKEPKNDHRKNIFLNLSSGQQYLSNDIKKFHQKWLVKKSKFVWRKKNPHRAQIFRYFRIESRNNKNLWKTSCQLMESNLKKLTN